jgi:hypothetical protein
VEPGIVFRAVPPGPLKVAMESEGAVPFRCRMGDGETITVRHRVRVLTPEGPHAADGAIGRPGHQG